MLSILDGRLFPMKALGYYAVVTGKGSIFECANLHCIHNPICGLQATQGVTLVRFRSMKENTLPSPSCSSMLHVSVHVYACIYISII